jgi:hypothetical protein
MHFRLPPAAVIASAVSLSLSALPRNAGDFRPSRREPSSAIAFNQSRATRRSTNRRLPTEVHLNAPEFISSAIDFLKQFS